MKACEWTYESWQELWRFLYHTLTKSLNQQIKCIGQLTWKFFNIGIPWTGMLRRHRVPGWQRLRLSRTSPAWTSLSKANLTTPTSEHPTSLTHWDLLFHPCIPAEHWVLQCSATQRGYKGYSQFHVLRE